jgi:hypothetical protein
MKYISMILANEILDVLEQSGASEVEKLAALQIALTCPPKTVPV